MKEEKNFPIDFSEITQEEIDKADNYKKINEYEILDLLKAIVDSEEEKEDSNNE